MARARRLRVISLFTGAGGLDLGFEAAGFETVACVEQDPDARGTIEGNRPHWGLLPKGDIHENPPADVLSAAGIASGEVDVLIGGPPCQPFSKSGYWSKGDTGRLQDVRADTLRAMMVYAEAMLPRAILIENVLGIAFENKDEAISFVTRSLQRINRKHGTSYSLSAHPLSAVDYGVPQMRDRAFLVAFRDGTEFVAPNPTHGDFEGACSRRLNAWDAIGGLYIPKKELVGLRLTGKWADLLGSIPEGENYLWHTERGGGAPLFGWRTRYWSFLLKLSKTLPAWTLQASPGPATGPFHWENRNLSVGEMCRLQTFPDDYEIHGNYRSARRQLGNAVPSALAEAMARKMRSYLLDIRYVQKQSLVVEARRKNTRVELLAQVPEKYLHLVGDHDEHPGIGLGPRAAKRAPETIPRSSVGPAHKRRKNANLNTINLGRKKLTTTKIA